MALEKAWQTPAWVLCVTQYLRPFRGLENERTMLSHNVHSLSGDVRAGEQGGGGGGNKGHPRITFSTIESNVHHRPRISCCENRTNNNNDYCECVQLVALAGGLRSLSCVPVGRHTRREILTASKLEKRRERFRDRR